MKKKWQALEEGPYLLGRGGQVGGGGTSTVRMAAVAVSPEDVHHNDMLFIVALIVSVGLVIVFLICIARHAYRVYKARELIARDEAANKEQERTTPQEIIDLFKTMKCITSVCTDKEECEEGKSSLQILEADTFDLSSCSSSCSTTVTSLNAINDYDVEKGETDESGSCISQIDADFLTAMHNLGDIFVTKCNENKECHEQKETTGVRLHLGEFLAFKNCQDKEPCNDHCENTCSCNLGKMCSAHSNVDPNDNLSMKAQQQDYPNGNFLAKSPTDEAGAIPFLTDNESPEQKKSLVLDCCAICIENYQHGQVVVWSPSQACRHVYHRDCMVPYILAREMAGEWKIPCPTCKNTFINLPGMGQASEVIGGSSQVHERNDNMADLEQQRDDQSDREGNVSTS